MVKKRAQAGVEYMIIIGFVTMAILAILLLANTYSGLIKDRIKLNQLETFSIQLVNHAESVFFAGEPSITTISLYLPAGVQDITVNSDAIITTTSTTTGNNIRSFSSRVPLQGTINAGEGIHTITIEAKSDHVLLTD